MKAFVYYNDFSHLPMHERQYGKQKIRKRLFVVKDKEELFHIVYGRNCSESYCYPRSDYRLVSKSLTSEFKQWEKDGGIRLFAKYNRMD